MKTALVTPTLNHQRHDKYEYKLLIDFQFASGCCILRQFCTESLLQVGKAERYDYD